MNTGQILKECRKRRGMTVKDVAFKALKAPSYIRYAEGRSGCTVENFETILHAMGFEIDIMPIEKLRGDV